MWRRAMLAAAAVSYLICVLIMSGMQKEDLDTNMLRKLERYNVNLDDINNELLRQQCASKNNDFTTGDQTYKMKENYISTTEYKTSITTEDPLTSVTFNMNSLLNYLKTRKDVLKNLEDTTTEKTTRAHHGVTISVGDQNENIPKLDGDILRRYIQSQTQKKSVYKLNNNTEAMNHDTSINLKTNERNSNAVDGVAFMNKLFQNYFLQKQKITSTTEYATTKYTSTIDIQSIYKQIDEIIANGSNIRNEEDSTVKKYSGDTRHNNTKYNDVISTVKFVNLNQERYLAGNKLFQSFYNFVNEMNQFKNISSRLFPKINYNLQLDDEVQRDTFLKPFNQNEREKNNESTTALTPSLVSKIAETMREVIIKDLHNELAGIYLKTTQTTTINIPTTTKPTVLTSRTQEKDISIMDKFMDLYEQIKSLKEATFSMRPNNESSTPVNYLKRQIKPPANTALFTPPLIGLQISDTQASIPSIGNYYPKQLFNNNLYLPIKENNRPIPITIQTNSVEIQPLAVRISKPESIIRQNIVVQSKHRYQDRKEHLRQFSQRGNSYSDSNKQLKHKNRTYKHSPLKRYDGYNSERYLLHHLPQEPKQREDIIRFRMRNNGNSRFDTDYYEKINFGNDGNVANEQHGIFRNRNIPRFHERLERIDTGSDAVQVVSDIDIKDKREETVHFPPRQQTSLIDMKKGSSYDDTHFKNFLNTQQKVTDMLERILASRPKSMPRSVETI